MSYTELHTGKLRVCAKEMSIESLKLFLERNEGLIIDDFKEKLEDERTYFEIQEGDWRGAYKFIYSNGTLYEVLEHKDLGEADFLDETKDNGDGTIEFTYLFYNGGTCFSEMLEEGLDKIHKS